MIDIQITQSDDKPLTNHLDKVSFHSTEIPKDKILDKFYEEVGYSRYLILKIFLIYLLNVSIGSESIFLNVIELELIKQWSLAMHQVAMLISFFSFGIAIGKPHVDILSNNLLQCI